MIRRLYNGYNDLSMRYKLCIQYLLLILVPFMTFILINNYISKKDLETQAFYSSRQSFEQGRSFLEYKIDTVNTYMTVLSINDKLQDILQKDPAVYKDQFGIWGFDINEIRRQFIISRPNSDISNISMYLNASIASIGETDDIIKISHITNTDWYKNIESENNTFIWFNDGSKTVSAARKILNANKMQSSLGIIRVDIPQDVFSSVLNHVAFFPSSRVYLIDNNGNILDESTNTHSINNSFTVNIIKTNSPDQLISGLWGKYNLNKEDYLVGIQSVKGADLYLVIYIPYNEILASQSKAIKQMLLITLLIAPFTLPLAFIGAYSATERIRKLISNMKIIKQGNFNVGILPSGKDEIGELTRTFNSMVTEIAMLLDEKYELGKEIKSMELKALQAQINPHFLYNTLDLIYWKAMWVNEKNIPELVRTLTQFYKLSLSKGEDIVSLENEIEHVKAYVYIQNARFKNGITLNVDIPETIYSCKIPKITLQPIVENSIIHGILERKGGKGRIKITGCSSENKTIIEVTDDGVGIPYEKLISITETDCQNPSNGYGIRNINKRIKLLYGEEYGLSYTSQQGIGATVSIILPGIS